MTEVNYIGEQVNKKGKTYADVARKMGRDKRIVKKYADMEDFNPDYQVFQS